MAMEERGAMFDEFVEGGGGADDIDGVIQSARFEVWDYMGKQAPVFALKVDLIDDSRKVWTEHLSCGELRFFAPSSDGKRAIPQGSAQKLNLNTNAVIFLMSLMNADTRGQLSQRIRTVDDISVIDGTRVHVVQKPQPKRAGLESQPIINPATGQPVPGSNRVNTSMQVDRLYAYPWETGAAATPPPMQMGAPAQAAATAPGGNGQAGPAVTAQAVGAAASDLDNTALGLLCQLVMEAGGSLKISAIAGKVFTNAQMKAEQPAVRNAVLGLIVRPDFLNAPGRPWTVDAADQSIKLG